MLQPPKVLLLYAHPESQDSVANRVLLQPVQQLEHVTVHDLYAHYPDFFIDIHHEQQLLRDHSSYCISTSFIYLQLPCITERVVGSGTGTWFRQWRWRPCTDGKALALGDYHR